MVVAEDGRLDTPALKIPLRAAQHGDLSPTAGWPHPEHDAPRQASQRLPACYLTPSLSLSLYFETLKLFRRENKSLKTNRKGKMAAIFRWMCTSYSQAAAHGTQPQEKNTLKLVFFRSKPHFLQSRLAEIYTNFNWLLTEVGKSQHKLYIYEILWTNFPKLRAAVIPIKVH